MRHRVKRKKLGLDYDHKRAVVRILLRTLFTKGKVETTLAKGKYLLSRGERVVSEAKKDNLVFRRFLFRLFQDQVLVNQIAEATKNLVAKRKSGFLRLRKIKRRKGDNAVVVRVEFVDNYQLPVKEKGESEKEEEKNGKKKE